MNQKRKILQQLSSLLVITALLLASSLANGQDGKALFNQKCASCHAIDKNLVGPALKGVEDRWDDKAMLYDWVRNSAAVIKKGYPRAVAVYNEYNKIQMSAFPELKDADIDAIIGYVNTGGAKAAVAAVPVDGAPTSGEEDSESNLLYGILTLILAVIALILLTATCAKYLTKPKVFHLQSRFHSIATRPISPFVQFFCSLVVGTSLSKALRKWEDQSITSRSNPYFILTQCMRASTKLTVCIAMVVLRKANIQTFHL
jgi:cytochrome c551/c552